MSKLPITEDLDFSYLLGLMPPLHGVPEFEWLPELFSIIGHKKLIKLSQYAGGETIRIPTVDELSKSVDALQVFYDIHIKKIREPFDIPDDLKKLVLKIAKEYELNA